MKRFFPVTHNNDNVLLESLNESRKAATVITFIFGPNVCDSNLISPQHGQEVLTYSASQVVLLVSTSLTVSITALTLEA
jgi:hypothetical protein